MKASAILIIILVGCVLTAPVLIYGISSFSDDGVLHAAWYVGFSKQLWAGILYPRWLPDLNGGLGSPTFFYYPPIAFFLTSLLKPFFPNDITGAQQVGVSASAAVIASGIVAYLWIKNIVNTRSAVIFAILYMITPYHLVSDLYIRSSFAELWAFVWLPLILYFTHNVLNNRRWSFVGLAISYSLLIMTHLPTTLIFSILPLAWVAVEAEAGQKLRRLIIVSGAMFVGIGLTGIYLFPAMTTQSSVFIDRLSTGYFSYQNWLFFSRFDLWTFEKIRLSLLVIDLAVIACSTYAVINQAKSASQTRKMASFWFGVAVTGILMQTNISRPIWFIVTPLEKIQFPWRFNVIVSLAVAVLCAYAISCVKNSGSFKFTKATVIALLSVSIWIPSAGYGMWRYFMPEDGDRASTTVLDAPEYRPRWSQSMDAIDWVTTADEDFWISQMQTEYEGLMQRTGASAENPSRVNIVDGAGQAEVISWKPREILLHVITTARMKINISQFYYPNWRALIVGEQRELEVQPSQPDGLLSLDVPNGEYNILLKLDVGSSEFTGQMISLVTSLGLSFYILVLVLSGIKRRYSSG